jgi:hypothetical protein
VCLRNMSINTLHKGDDDDDNNNGLSVKTVAVDRKYEALMLNFIRLFRFQ